MSRTDKKPAAAPVLGPTAELIAMQERLSTLKSHYQEQVSSQPALRTEPRLCSIHTKSYQSKLDSATKMLKAVEDSLRNLNKLAHIDFEQFGEASKEGDLKEITEKLHVLSFQALRVRTFFSSDFQKALSEQLVLTKEQPTEKEIRTYLDPDDPMLSLLIEDEQPINTERCPLYLSR